MKFFNTVGALALLLAFALAAPAFAADRTFVVDNTHARIGFSVTHMVISSVKGEFKQYEGSFTLTDRNELVGATATIQAASLDTGVEKRDEHLRSP
ncbi:MAG: YceI family protein, partial [Nitrospinae bacterium]|nr:YceI family protein [Nitrospinota bacterium]